MLMKSNLFLILLSLIGFTACQTSTAQTSTSEPPAKFSVHAEVMQPTTARNVAINNKSVTACFQNCDVQILLNFSGQCIIERTGQSPDVYAAQVFQLEKGVWIAHIDGGQYVKLFTESGTAQLDIAGQFKVLIPAQ